MKGGILMKIDVRAGGLQVFFVKDYLKPNSYNGQG
jgi:hypothetical protein